MYPSVTPEVPFASRLGTDAVDTRLMCCTPIKSFAILPAAIRAVGTVPEVKCVADNEVRSGAGTKAVMSAAVLGIAKPPTVEPS
jgi:hypothetical protein